MGDDLRIYRLRDGRYERQSSPRFPSLRLGLMLWEGMFEDVGSTWLRWTDEHDVLIPMASEQRDRANRERDRANREHQRAEQERQRAERLAQALLRQSGIDTEQG